MSWTYSGNPANSQVDECRFLLGDTNESAPIMQDEEIQYIIDTYGSNENQVLYQLQQSLQGTLREVLVHNQKTPLKDLSTLRSKLIATRLSLLLLGYLFLSMHTQRYSEKECRIILRIHLLKIW